MLYWLLGFQLFQRMKHTYYGYFPILNYSKQTTNSLNYYVNDERNYKN